MKSLQIREGHILEILIDHNDKRSVVIKFDDESTKTFTLKDDAIIMNDDDFIHRDAETLKIMLPVYIYEEEGPDLSLIIVRQNEDYLFQKIGLFNEDLISDDGSIQINESRINFIESIDASFNMRSVLKNKNLLVFYHNSTRSIPAIVDPIKIIIM